jgi:hypothetical protein
MVVSGVAFRPPSPFFLWVDKITLFLGLWALITARAFGWIPIWLLAAAVPYFWPRFTKQGRKLIASTGQIRWAWAFCLFAAGLALRAVDSPTVVPAAFIALALVSSICSRGLDSEPRTPEAGSRDVLLFWLVALLAPALSMLAYLELGPSLTLSLLGLSLLGWATNPTEESDFTRPLFATLAARNLCLAPILLCLPLFTRHLAQDWLGGMGGVRDLPIAAAVLGLVVLLALQTADRFQTKFALGLLLIGIGALAPTIDRWPELEIFALGGLAVLQAIANVIWLQRMRDPESQTGPLLRGSNWLTAGSLPLSVALLAFALGFVPRHVLALGCGAQLFAVGSAAVFARRGRETESPLRAASTAA